MCNISKRSFQGPWFPDEIRIANITSDLSVLQRNGQIIPVALLRMAPAGCEIIGPTAPRSLRGLHEAGRPPSSLQRYSFPVERVRPVDSPPPLHPLSSLCLLPGVFTTTTTSANCFIMTWPFLMFVFYMAQGISERITKPQNQTEPDGRL